MSSTSHAFDKINHKFGKLLKKENFSYLIKAARIMYLLLSFINMKMELYAWITLILKVIQFLKEFSFGM